MNQTQAFQWLRAFHEIHPALTPELERAARDIEADAILFDSADDDSASELHFDAFRADHLPRADDAEKAAFKEIEDYAILDSAAEVQDKIRALIARIEARERRTRETFDAFEHEFRGRLTDVEHRRLQNLRKNARDTDWEAGLRAVRTDIQDRELAALEMPTAESWKQDTYRSLTSRRGALLKKMDALVETLSGKSALEIRNTPALQAALDELCVQQSIWLTKHQDYAQRGDGEQRRLAAILASIDHIREMTQAIDHTKEPLDKPGETHRADPTRVGDQARPIRGDAGGVGLGIAEAGMEVVSEGFDTASDAIDAHEIAGETGSVIDRIAADTDVTEVVGGGLDALGGILAGGGAVRTLARSSEGLETTTEKEALRRQKAQAGLEATRATLETASGLTGIVSGGAVGVDEVVGEAVGELIGGAGDLVATAYHAREAHAARSAGTQTSAARDAVHAKGETARDDLRGTVDPTYVRDLLALEAMASDGLNLLDARNTTDVYLPSGTYKPEAAKRRFAQMREDPLFQAYLQAQSAERALGVAASWFTTKTAVSAVAATASAVSAVGTVSAAGDLGVTKAVGAALKGGVFLTRLGIRGSRKTAEVAEVEQLKKHMGKDTGDSRWTTVRKVLTPGGAERSRDKLQKQVEAVQRIALLGTPTAADITRAWAAANCMPVHEADKKAQNVADLWNRKADALEARGQDADYSFQEIDALLLAKDERVAHALFDLAMGGDEELARLAQAALEAIHAPIHVDEIRGDDGKTAKARKAVVGAFHRAIAV